MTICYINLAISTQMINKEKNEESKNRVVYNNTEYLVRERSLVHLDFEYMYINNNVRCMK